MDDSPQLAALRVNAEMRQMTKEALPRLVKDARNAGHEWLEIVAATGLSRAQLFKIAPPEKKPPKSTLST